MLAAVFRASISSDACLSDRSSGRLTPWSLQQPVEVGMLPCRDRADRTDLVLRSPASAVGTDPAWGRSAWPLPPGWPFDASARRQSRRIVRRLDGHLQPGQLVVDGLVGGDVDVAHPGVESVEVVFHQSGVTSTSRLQLAP